LSIKDRDAVLAFLAENSQGSDASLAERRARLESWAQFFPVPDGDRIE
jgi:hypothetical protein